MSRRLALRLKLIAITIVTYNCKCNRNLKNDTLQSSNEDAMNPRKAPSAPKPPGASNAIAACLRELDDAGMTREARPGSPLRMAHSIVRTLAADAMASERAWVVRADIDGPERQGAPASAWPLRYMASSHRLERPLIYMLNTESRAGLKSAFQETSGRGLFLNTAQSAGSRWPKGVRPELALWLADDSSCMPYDPATAGEVAAIMRGALHALYVEGEAAYYYIALHDDGTAEDTSASASLNEAYTGMYQLRRESRRLTVGPVRLLGAGMALPRVIRAAEMLQQEWHVGSEVWSCPSYTRLAREGAQVAQWNTLNPLAPRRISRLAHCLGEGGGPVIAVTDYERHVAAGIGAWLAPPFVALGAGSQQRDVPVSAEWIVLHALKALAGEGRLPMRSVTDALHRYGLAQKRPPRDS
ncbi:transketolase-like TK C-terminal-containing protein [Herbaspirillum robiniae]|uniref:Pyruvate dehydrogenase n=1 Tax=Herbaspirillum robiniae TaxID=2014887 RepID=A0ABX2M367_9BURK|nr:pyruvate dehydrogenase [Herbaspirillum robiniae]NUU02712.1 pyruvate dehydrogenase [Herbaspirillum robiniae]